MKEAIVDLFPHIPLQLLESDEQPHGPITSESEKEKIPKEVYSAHPQVWGLIQAFIIPSTLPFVLRQLEIPLTDAIVPSLQHSSILSTDTLQLLTCVSLETPEERLRVTDDTLLQFRTLPCLTVLNLAGTPVTSRGIRRLIVSMRSMENTYSNCPWKLRVLDLRRTFVDDTVLEETNSLSVLPLLCVLDVRDTKVTNQACSTFRTDWGSFTPPPDNLFAPTKANLVMTNVLQEIRNSALIAGHTAIEHALLSLQLPSQTIAKPAEITPLADHERAQKDQRLRLNTSGVVVVTPESVVLGNVVEIAGTAEEGPARSQFT
ncbi:hypothetical protein FRB91_001060, partial [Serendipita sp. 411]